LLIRLSSRARALRSASRRGVILGRNISPATNCKRAYSMENNAAATRDLI
jgi:hypothetical protein